MTDTIDSSRHRRAFPPLELVVFVVGVASLGTEIAAARLMAPFFGTSTIVWANTIGVVLVALSIGYWLGGRFADRHPNLSGLCTLVLVAALGVAAIPFVAEPFLDVSVQALDELQAGAFVGSLVAVVVLVAPPIMLLGAVSPYAIRLTLDSVEHSGAVAGRMYAISTVGSLVGTFASALLFIPVIGTQRTFIVYALICALVALPGVVRRQAAVLVPAAIVVLLLLPVGTIKAAGDARVLAEVETEYQYARVLEDPDGTRRLELNEGQAIHSLYRPGRHLTGDYWDEFLTAPFAVLDRHPARVAILGNAAGTTARAYGRYYPGTQVDAVEIDPELTGLGRRYFDLRGPRMTIHHDDARRFLRISDSRYDVIMVDAYRQPYIPFHLTTREFFELAADRLEPGGVVAINVGHPEGDDELEKVMSATIGAVFPHVARDPTDDTNTIVLASHTPISGEAIDPASDGLDPDLHAPARRTAGLIAAPLDGGEVYTDDRAPVEWLIDRSIVRYASGAEQD